jgi:iron complex transport system ATP-binding protein
MSSPGNWLPRNVRLDRLALRAGGKPDGRVLCQDLDVRFSPGERWVILGPNGAGKSTLLMALAGLLAPDAGQIVLGDRDLQRWRGHDLARVRAWCPQFWLDPFPVTAWETVASAILATDPGSDAPTVERLARQCLSELDAVHLADRDVCLLSGGERQRVALATTFAQKAPLLLLDEPTSHLDWSHQGLLHDRLRDWSAQQGTILAALHDVNLAWLLATHALLLDGKGNTLHGPRDEVLTAEAVGLAYGLSVKVTADGDTRWFHANLEHPT